MREEGELDVYLPLLLTAMGHELVYRAQKGTRQYGVDMSSVGQDEDGTRKLFLWLVKCGDLGRADWSSGPQAIRPSIDDVGDVYLANHIAKQYKRLPVKLVIVTNGDFNAALTLELTSYLDAWSARHGAEVSQVNGSTLASWTEQHLLDEHVLPPSQRTLLRRMLANVGSPEISVEVGRTLVSDLVGVAVRPDGSSSARRKRKLSALRGLRTALSVLQVWATHEGNLLAPYRLAEFAVLSVWSAFHDVLVVEEADLTLEFAALVGQMTAIGVAYHAHLHPFYMTQDAFASELPDSLLVAERVFTELGRLGLQGSMLANWAVRSGSVEFEEQAVLYADWIAAMLDTHSCSQSPAYDHNAVDIHAALLTLMFVNRREVAARWVGRLAGRLARAVGAESHWPLSAPFEDALFIRHDLQPICAEHRATSTLIPVLLVWTAALGLVDAYTQIRAQIVPSVPETTPNLWNPDAGFDGILADPSALQAHGVAEILAFIGTDPNEWLESMSAGFAGVEAMERSAWYRFRAFYLPLLSALHWHLQVPREMLVAQAVAVCRHAV